MDNAAVMPGHEPGVRLSALDAAFLYLERNELPLAIGNVSVFAGAIPFAGFVKSMAARLPLLPRYRQKIARPLLDLARPAWQDDPRFDIRRHIFQVKLDPPGTEAQLRALAGRVFSGRMDRGKPLWELYVVGGLEHGRSALITKVHHAMADGVSGVALLEATLDASPKGRALPRPRPYRPRPAPGGWRRLLDPLAGAFEQAVQGVLNTQKALWHLGLRLAGDPRAREGVLELFRRLPELAWPAERLPFNRPCGCERRVAWSEFSLAEVRAIRAACGGTVNDIVLSALTAALRRYLRMHGETVRRRFCHVMVPVSVRAADHAPGWGNRVSLLPLALPLEEPDPVARLRAVTRRTGAMKKVPVAEAVALLSTLLDAAPAPLQALLSAVPFVSLPFPLYNFLCTNVPGPPAPRYVCGRRMLASYPHVPTGYEAGVSLAVESYHDKLYLGLTVDPQAAPDGERMKELLDVSFVELARAARLSPGLSRARNKNAA
jgi:WS/DGAT/MGAT family acyltransferase